MTGRRPPQARRDGGHDVVVRRALPCGPTGNRTRGSSADGAIGVKTRAFSLDLAAKGDGLDRRGTDSP